LRFTVRKGQTHGLAPIGMRALGTLRLEKSYRRYGDVSPGTDTFKHLPGSGLTNDIAIFEDCEM
jgi:glycine cleavage system aminomethyltransferase T